MFTEHKFFIELENIYHHKMLEEVNGTTLMISSVYLGRADKTLGSILMKEFLSKLNNNDILPKNIFLYNQGVLLSKISSSVYHIFKNLEKKGVNIFLCKSSLNFYNIPEESVFGEAVDMEFIVNGIFSSEKVIIF